MLNDVLRGPAGGPCGVAGSGKTFALGDSGSGKTVLLPKLVQEHKDCVVMMLRSDWPCAPTLAVVCEKAGFIKLN